MLKITKTILLLAVSSVFAPALSAQDLSGYSLTVQQDPGSDQLPALTPLRLIGRGAGGNPYSWTIYTAATGGGHGVRPNAFEVWEYPPANMNNNCCIQRFGIDKSLSNTSATPVFIDSRGGLALGGFADANGNKLSVDGNVGIGTNDTHGYRLAVNGSIHTQEVKVDMQGWPDFVFKPAYKLMPLREVKIYIDRNGHLPEVIPAEEASRSGIELGAMNKLLIKKVEELTLYLLEKDRQYTRLKQTVDRNQANQQRQLATLKKQLVMLNKGK
jgi:hypothetical protein